MGKILEDGIRPRRDSAGEFPLDKHLMKSLESYTVSFTLLPLPQQKKPSGPPATPKPKAIVKTTQFKNMEKAKAKQRAPTRARVCLTRSSRRVG